MPEEIIIEKRKPMAGKLIITALVSAVIFGSVGYIYGDNNLQGSFSKEASFEPLDGPIDGTPYPPEPPSPEEAQTFRQNDLDFSFRVPDMWVAVEQYNCEGACSSQVTLAEQTPNQFVSYKDMNITITVTDSKVSLDEAYAQDEGEKLKVSETKIDGQVTKKYSIAGMFDGVTYLAEKDGKILKIENYPSNNEDEKYIDEIIKSFKFSK